MSNKTKFLVRTAVGLCVGILAIYTGRYVFNNYLDNSLTASTAYTAYFKPFEISLNTRSANKDCEPVIIKGIGAYYNGDYKTASLLFDSLTNKSSAIYLYNGICKMELGDYKNAVVNFDSIVIKGNNPYTEHALWYKSLTLLKTGEQSKAIALLNEISKSDNYHKKDALLIINNLH